MRSLQEEIAPFSSPQADRQLPDDGGVSTSAGDPRESDLGYLLEASDDELGLPPTVPSSDEGEGAEGETGEVGTQGPEGLGQIWALEEIRSCYDALEFAEFGQVVGGGDDGLVFDGGMFDYADAASLVEQEEAKKGLGDCAVTSAWAADVEQWRETASKPLPQSGGPTAYGNRGDAYLLAISVGVFYWT
ncbi:hypothetical protein Taro_035075 [Colocasia esculenta]|uniref:Uncharacterized protein n=1 Tax=Colocasia esculenta TaxID=4460 RepID=A0A843VZG9_COLES|nr:hypothetical protein [Colocasia esculenta]